MITNKWNYSIKTGWIKCDNGTLTTKQANRVIKLINSLTFEEQDSLYYILKQKSYLLDA